MSMDIRMIVCPSCEGVGCSDCDHKGIVNAYYYSPICYTAITNWLKEDSIVKHFTILEAGNYEHMIREHAKKLIEGKRKDYSGEEDPYANFRMAEFVGIEPWRGVMVRLMDKLSRIRRVVEAGEMQIKDETIDDTIADAVNYVMILGGLIKEASRE